jgi:hypothetical protein
MTRDMYFSPPNADPYYHELPRRAGTNACLRQKFNLLAIFILVSWINNLYDGALAAEFTRRNIPFFNQDRFDLFYLGYGICKQYLFLIILSDSFLKNMLAAGIHFLPY